MPEKKKHPPGRRSKKDRVQCWGPKGGTHKEKKAQKSPAKKNGSDRNVLMIQRGTGHCGGERVGGGGGKSEDRPVEENETRAWQSFKARFEAWARSKNKAKKNDHPFCRTGG